MLVEVAAVLATLSMNAVLDILLARKYANLKNASLVVIGYFLLSDISNIFAIQQLCCSSVLRPQNFITRPHLGLRPIV